MSVGRQRVVSCVVDETIDLKAKFAQLRCKSLRQNISPRFNTASFTLVHSSEKLWSIVIFCPKREKEEEELERAYVYVYFLSYIMALYGGKMGAEIMGLKRITVIMALMIEDQVKEALMAEPLI